MPNPGKLGAIRRTRGDAGAARAERSMVAGRGLDTEPPDWLPDTAKEEWRSLVAELADQGLSNRDRMALCITAVHFAAWRVCVQRAFADPEDAGAAEWHGPSSQDARMHADLLKKYLPEFGCTPSSRLRMALAQQTPKKGKHADIMARKKAVEANSN